MSRPASRLTLVCMMAIVVIVTTPQSTQSGGLSSLFKLVRNLADDAASAGARSADEVLELARGLGRRQFNAAGGRAFNSDQTRFAASLRREAYLRTAASTNDDTGRIIDDVSARPIGTHAVYAAVPDDALAFRKMFDTSATAKNMREVSNANRMLDNASFQVTRASQATDDVTTFLKETDAQIVSFIGHNDDGLLRLSAEVSIRIDDLATQCAANGRVCVFFSCRAQDHLRAFKVQNGLGSKVDLNFDEAIRSVYKLDEAVDL